VTSQVVNKKKKKKGKLVNKQSSPSSDDVASPTSSPRAVIKTSLTLSPFDLKKSTTLSQSQSQLQFQLSQSQSQPQLVSGLSGMKDGDDGSWKTVKDTKKEKYLQRLDKKKQQLELEAKAALAQGDLTLAAFGSSGETAAASGALRTASADDDDELLPDLKKGLKNGKKKKSKKKSVQLVNITNQVELIRLIYRLFANLPNNQTTFNVATLGQTIQDVTGQSWNKKFKKTYGTLLSFLETQPDFEVFRVGNGSPVVGLKKEEINIKAKNQKRKAPLDSHPNSHSQLHPGSGSGSGSYNQGQSASQSRRSNRGDSDGDNQSASYLRIVIVLLLIIAAAVLTVGYVTNLNL